MSFDLSDYVEVADRVRAWYEEYPEGRIETSVEELTEARVMVRAQVYRSFNGPPAGVGHSYLAIPGKTPYTLGSELENAETSAVGRALVFAGISARNVASAGEVKAKSNPQRSQATETGIAVGGAGGGGDVEGKASPATAPSDDDMTGELFVEALQTAVAEFGSTSKVVLAAKRKHPEWAIRSEADFLGWHLIQLVKEGA